MRQYGEVPPVLAASNIPVVSSVSGLGTGGGASCQTPSNGGFGTINVYAGPGASSSGSVVLAFPNTPPSLFIAGNTDFGTISQSTSGNNVTISWTGASLKANGKAHTIAYEWSTSY